MSLAVQCVFEKQGIPMEGVCKSGGRGGEYLSHTGQETHTPFRRHVDSYWVSHTTLSCCRVKLELFKGFEPPRAVFEGYRHKHALPFIGPHLNCSTPPPFPTQSNHSAYTGLVSAKSWVIAGLPSGLASSVCDLVPIQMACVAP